MIWDEAARERLRQAARVFGSQKALSAAAGVPTSTLQKILAGDVEPGIVTFSKIASKLGVSADWLLTGDPRRLSISDLIRPSIDLNKLRSQPSGNATGTVGVPEYDVEVAAGHGRFNFDEQPPIQYWLFPAGWLSEHFGNDANLKLVRVSGDSQEPELRPRDAVMIDTNATKVREGMAVVRLDEALLIKRLQIEGRTIKLVSNNKAYDDVKIDLQADHDRFAIVGRAVWAGKLL